MVFLSSTKIMGIKKSCFLTIAVDALAPHLINKVDTPFIYGLASKYSSTNIRTTLTFTQFCEIFANLVPQESDIWTITKRSEKSDFAWMRYLPFSKNLPNKFIDIITNVNRLLRGKTYFASKARIPNEILRNFAFSLNHQICHKEMFADSIFNLLRQNNKSFVYISLPVLYDGKYHFIRKMEDEEVVKQALKIKNKKDFDFYHLYFRGVDALTHYNGLHSPAVKKRLRELDQMVKRLYLYFDKSYNLDFMLFSDHSMVDIVKLVNVKKVLDNYKELLYFLDSTLARIWVKNKDLAQELISKLNGLDGGHILDADEKEKFGINFKHNDYGDIIFLAEPGALILPNFFQGEKPVKAMHSYEPIEELDGYYLINRKLKLPSRGSIFDLYPTMLKVLNIKAGIRRGRFLV